MNPDEKQPRLAGDSARFGVRAAGLLGKALTFATGAVLVVVGLMFSVLAFAVAATVALVVLGYVWWRTRDLRRRMRQHPPGGRVIEGEVIRDFESH